MAWTIDHVPYACRDLEATAAAFERIGLEPTYGGAHDNGATHMSVIGFDDLTYVELIAEHTPGDHDYWPTHIRADAGPADWCVRVDDLVSTCRRMLEAGIAVDGPSSGARERADGTLVEWDIAWFGAGSRRCELPFAIEDRTPLERRVPPEQRAGGGTLTGLDAVVVAVADLDRSVRWFRETLRHPTPDRSAVPGFGDVAVFPGRALTLVEGSTSSWLAERLDRVGPGPCSCLIGTDDLGDAAAAVDLREPVAWPGGRVAFVDSDVIGDRLGVVERSSR
ncbi:MAG: VOC family protein [Halobacteriota archaeon]